ncbi:hypothetical protein ACQKNB_19880 [Lysinibacillus xylanilyticus]|uniref:hypothetical protein n=1 Tax=Lysinibacillus xylanilyticus TaxID=582475 RepID=UPI003D0500BA
MKIGNNIVKKLGVFMTDTDKKIFSELLFEKFQNIYLIDNKSSKNKNIKLLSFLSEANVSATILNSSIFSLDDYKKLVELQNSPPYSFPMVGKGMIQYVPSNIAQYDPKCLKDGYLSASYNSDDKETEHYIKQVFKTVGQNGKKVFLTSKYREIVADVAEKNIVAWPNAAIEYNGNNGRYLTQTKERMLISK